MRHFTILLFLLMAGRVCGAEREMLLIVGAEGDASFKEPFETAAAAWKDAAEAGDVNVRRLEEKSEIEGAIAEVLASAETRELWIVLIGHGTWNGREAKFNLRGDDLTDEELQKFLAPWDRSLLVINTASSSATFLPVLAGEGRVIVTANKSPSERNLTRFGNYLATALTDPVADLNKDEQISILEAFLLASGRTDEFYENEGRIATEHALLDDNGDGKGIRADWFEGLRLIRQAADDEALPDGLEARHIHLVPNETDRALSAEARERRNELEREVELLRPQREAMGDEAWYDRLEEIFLEIAEIYRAVET